MFLQNEHSENKMSNKDTFKFREVCVTMCIYFDIINEMYIRNKTITKIETTSLNVLLFLYF